MHARILIQNGVETIAEVVAFDPATMFTPEIAAEFVPATAGMVYRARKVGGVWVAPPPPAPTPDPVPPAPAFRTKVSRAEYYGLFTPVEEAMIRMTAAEPVTRAAVDAATVAEKQGLLAKAALAVMLRRTDALEPSAAFELSNPQVGQGLDLLQSLGLITGARKTEILKGVPL